LNSTELQNVLIESGALLNTIHPISTTNQSVDQFPLSMDRVKNRLQDAMNVVNLLPSAQQPSTSYSNNTDSNDTEMKKMKKIEEANRIRIYRKYKNKYNYIDQIKPPSVDSVNEAESQNNLIENPTITNVSYSVQNDLNDNTQNDIVQNDLNGPFTRQDIENDRKVYELLKSNLKNSPYDGSAFVINNVNATHFSIKLPNGEECLQSLDSVQPLVVINKFETLFSQFAEKFKKKKYNNNNNNKATTKMNKRETRTNTTKDTTNRYVCF